MRAMRAMPASLLYLPTRQRVCLPMCQKRANFSFLRANMPINVLTWQRRSNFSTWGTKEPKQANILTWRANVPKGVPFCQLRLSNGVPILNYFLYNYWIYTWFILNLYLIYILYIFYILDIYWAYIFYMNIPF